LLGIGVDDGVELPYVDGPAFQGKLEVEAEVPGQGGWLASVPICV